MPQLSTTGFRLDRGQTVQVPAPTGWSGRIWARTGCVFDAGGKGTCQTGDCGGRMECAGTGATPPATLFEVTLGKGAADQDYYDVSLVDGYNLPVVTVPRARQGGGGCNAGGCMAVADLNRCVRAGQVLLHGAYATCRPTAYSAIFKSACPRAYSYAYDDGSSTFTCSAADYTVAFCLPPSGLQKSSTVPLGSPPAGGGGQLSTGGGGAAADSTPPPTDDSGVGSTNQLPPPAASGGVGSGSTYQQPWLMPSAASSRRVQLWLLLPAVLLLLPWSL
ncbi:hypothetical protein ACP70R_000211 [Stipagrostis hirtigluma subsp. patula]